MDFSKLKVTEDKNREIINEPPFYKEVIFKGEELVNLEYEPVFDYFTEKTGKKVANSHRVLDGDFVTVEDGSGIVHIAPGFGEDDFNLCKKNNIGVVCPVDDGGCFCLDEKDDNIKYDLGDKHEVLKLNGRQVFETNDDVIKYLKSKDLWIKTEQYLHNYPHCWRTDTPLIYKAVSSWYVKVTEFKDRMCELNKQINWIPENVKDGQFGKWLENARDWSITRNRFWGAPVPVWIEEQVVELTNDNFRHPIFYSFNNVNFISHFTAEVEETKKAETHYKELKEILKEFIEMLKEKKNNPNKDIEKNLNKLEKKYNQKYIAGWNRSPHSLSFCAFIENAKSLLNSGLFILEKLSNTQINNFNDLIDFLISNLEKSLNEVCEEEAKFKKTNDAIFLGLPIDNGINIISSLFYNNFLFIPVLVPSSIQELETFFKDDYIADFKAGKNSGKYIKDKNNPEESFKIDDLHRPYIDELVKHTDGGDLKRVEDVLDCWFESGSMPYAQVHYPFEYRDGNGNLIRTKEENEKWFNSHFPCDFVTEYVAQTRGWFYTMVVLATALFDKIPFKNVICHGVMLDINGQKLSKRLRNYPDPLEMIDVYGSDAMRWLMASSPVVQGGDMRIDKDGKMIADIVKNILNPIWNAFMFYKQYAELDKIKISGKVDSKNVMDVYILSKLKLFVEKFENAMDKYNTIDACHEVELFIESLNNWYIRRNKERFWRSEHDENKQQAYETLHCVLKVFATAVAPVLPFLCEKIYQDLIKFEEK